MQTTKTTTATTGTCTEASHFSEGSTSISLNLPSSQWSKSISKDTGLMVSKVENINGVSKVSRSLSVELDGTWTIHVHGIKMQNNNALFSNFPKKLSLGKDSEIQTIINVLSEASVCPGHPDENYIDFVESCPKKVLLSSSNEKLASVDSFASVCYKG